MRKLGEKPKSKTEMTTVEMEQKETKTKVPAVLTIKNETCEIGESSLKLQEVGTKTEESKRISQTEGCVNKEDAEWYQKNISVALDQLKMQDEQLHMLVENFMLEIHRCMQHIKLQPEIGLAEIQDITT